MEGGQYLLTTSLGREEALRCLRERGEARIEPLGTGALLLALGREDLDALVRRLRPGLAGRLTEDGYAAILSELSGSESLRENLMAMVETALAPMLEGIEEDLPPAP